MSFFDFRLFVVLLAAAFGTGVGMVPYLRDVFRRRTQPHLYTWLIWSITQGTAAAAAWHDGGWSALYIGLGAMVALTVTALAFRYGTHNITRGDTIALVLALSAVPVWWALDDPLLAVLLVTVIDVVGYIPSFRKTYQEPWSETPATWLVFTMANTIYLLTLERFTWPTAGYMVAITLCNFIMFGISTLRRRRVPFAR